MSVFAYMRIKHFCRMPKTTMVTSEEGEEGEVLVYSLLCLLNFEKAK